MVVQSIDSVYVRVRFSSFLSAARAVHVWTFPPNLAPRSLSKFKKEVINFCFLLWQQTARSKMFSKSVKVSKFIYFSLLGFLGFLGSQILRWWGCYLLPVAFEQPSSRASTTLFSPWRWGAWDLTNKAMMCCD
jgi:hypothetical protein